MNATVMSISGISTIAFGLVFLVSFMIHNGPKTAKVGDVFIHSNPGTRDNPSEASRPFAMIYKVIEVKEGKALTERHCIHADGETSSYDRWLYAYGLGKHDKKVSR